MKASRNHRRTLPALCRPLAFSALLAFAAGCSFWDDPKDDPVPLPAALALSAGEKHTVRFPADAQWHPSSLLVEQGEKLTMKAVGASADLPLGAVVFNLNRQTNLIRPDSPFVVTKPGRLYFRLTERYATADRAGVEVEVMRLE